jgi:hypothetical protein
VKSLLQPLLWLCHNHQDEINSSTLLDNFYILNPRNQCYLTYSKTHMFPRLISLLLGILKYSFPNIWWTLLINLCVIYYWFSIIQWSTKSWSWYVHSEWLRKFHETKNYVVPWHPTTTRGICIFWLGESILLTNRKHEITTVDRK